uniref:Uncharacterized protein n=1 Tax=Arundo donax TaxID=35708 RepID=A0A0A8YI29_ARUDO
MYDLIYYFATNGKIENKIILATF